MTSAQKYAMEIAREIVVARAGSSSIAISGQAGKDMGEFFEQIYKKAYEIASKEEKA